MHQGFVLSPFISIVVVDVVTGFAILSNMG